MPHVSAAAGITCLAFSGFKSGDTHTEVRAYSSPVTIDLPSDVMDTDAWPFRLFVNRRGVPDGYSISHTCGSSIGLSLAAVTIKESPLGCHTKESIVFHFGPSSVI